MFSSRALCIAAALGLVTTLVTAEPHLTFEDTDAADGRLLGGTVSIQREECLDANSKCEKICLGGFIFSGSGEEVKTCKETQFGFRKGDFVQGPFDGKMGVVEQFQEDSVEVKSSMYGGSTWINPANLQAVYVGDRVSTPEYIKNYREGVVTAVDGSRSQMSLSVQWDDAHSGPESWFLDVRIVSKAYTAVQPFVGPEVCNEAGRIHASCGNDCIRSFDECKDLCDSHIGCSYFTYFSDARCQMYSSCSLKSDGGGARAAIYRKQEGWIKHTHKSCQGYANGDSTRRTLEESKARCLQNVACKAIECETGKTSSCTLRDKRKVIEFAKEDCYELKATPCFKSDTKYSPIVLPDPGRTVESSAADCQLRCASVSGCSHFSWWKDGGCHLHDADSGVQTSRASGVTAGPPTCKRETQPGGGRRLSGADGGPTVVV